MLNLIHTMPHSILEYTETSFILQNSIIDRNIAIFHDKLIQDWFTGNYENFSIEDLEAIIQWQPEIILLGTGARLHFPNPEIMVMLHKQNIGFEVMDTSAACRSYNFLLEEQRNVAACLLLAGYELSQ